MAFVVFPQDMPYVPFHEHFPDVSEEETRCLMGFNNPALPQGQCGLVEAYCDETDCDCRRVFLNMISEEGLLAVIAYGWEDEAYYVKWMKDDDPKAICELKGPTLNMGSPQSRWAFALLEAVKMVLKDKDYVERLKRHYSMFKEAIVRKPVQSVKIGRNDLCPCGSGVKFKKCCLGERSFR